MDTKVQKNDFEREYSKRRRGEFREIAQVYKLGIEIVAI